MIFINEITALPIIAFSLPWNTFKWLLKYYGLAMRWTIALRIQLLLVRPRWQTAMAIAPDVHCLQQIASIIWDAACFVIKRNIVLIIVFLLWDSGRGANGSKTLDSSPKEAGFRVVKGSISTGSTKLVSPERMSAFQKRAVQFDYVAKVMRKCGKSAGFACNLDVMCFCRVSNSIRYKWIYIWSVSVSLSLGAL